MGTLLWPESQRERLGMALLLFRKVAEGQIDPVPLAYQFAWTTGDANDLVDQLNSQIFRPFARHLRQYLQSGITAQEQNTVAGTAIQSVTTTVEVPASDRVVTLDHNSPLYRETMIALAELRVGLQQQNDYPHPDEKDRHIAEVEATTRLLQGIRVRASALVEIARPVLTYIADKFASGGLGAMAKTAWEGIKAMLGL